MAKRRSKEETADSIRPAENPESRENQLIARAVDLAEKKMIDGTASAQIIVHYLRLGSTKEKLEKEILERQKDLIEAKTQSLKSMQRMEELYENAIAAMRSYGPTEEGDEDEDDFR